MMPAGRYYVGDLCYVMHPQWDEFCSKTLFSPSSNSDEHEVRFDNGVLVSYFPTAYGDGNYYDQFGNSYPVDAGLIGCIRVEDICDPKSSLLLGNIIDFSHPFECKDDNGILYFGHIRIDTVGESDYVESDEYSDEEDE